MKKMIIAVLVLIVLLLIFLGRGKLLNDKADNTAQQDVEQTIKETAPEEKIIPSAIPTEQTTIESKEQHVSGTTMPSTGSEGQHISGAAMSAPGGEGQHISGDNSSPDQSPHVSGN